MVVVVFKDEKGRECSLKFLTSKCLHFMGAQTTVSPLLPDPIFRAAEDFSWPKTDYILWTKNLLQLWKVIFGGQTQLYQLLLMQIYHLITKDFQKVVVEAGEKMNITPLSSVCPEWPRELLLYPKYHNKKLSHHKKSKNVAEMSQIVQKWPFWRTFLGYLGGCFRPLWPILGMQNSFLGTQDCSGILHCT